MRRASIERCFEHPVIPVVWDPAPHHDLIARASAVILQGGNLADIERTLDRFSTPPLHKTALFVHIDLVAGLENSEAGLEFLATFQRLTGVVTVHHHLATPARKLGLLSIVRLFLSDSRALERGLSIASKSRPDAIEILPAAVAAKVAADFQCCPIPRITGGICRTETDVRDALESGCRAVTSTKPELWRLNPA
jgi:glycerol uptake operon antiterminator